MMKTAKIIVSGRVHGVFFRAYAQENADRLGVKGYAINTSDGRVEIVAQGDEDKLEKFVELCRKGPGAARVDDVKVEDMKTKEKFEGFIIKR